MAFTLSRQKNGQEVFPKSNKRICTTVTSHFNTSKSNYLNTQNRDSVMGNLNINRINVHTKRSANELVKFQRETDTESSTSINKENMNDNKASEESLFPCLSVHA